MSRIGKKPVPLPTNVKANINGRTVTIESGKNKLSIEHHDQVVVKSDGKQITIERSNESRLARALHGLTRALISNMVTGVTTGFVKELELNGVGWTIKVQGPKVMMSVGYADVREVAIPPGAKVEVVQNRIKVSGPDKQVVGQLAAQIRSHRPPEPYNGKGIKYIDEIIVRKQGKAFAGGGA
ncbi:MAG: 50S ribosomal protein L6 [Planctomycetes bacterium]|nr:50S ribosomal protein L6 [Planctomycetota bacterium]